MAINLLETDNSNCNFMLTFSNQVILGSCFLAKTCGVQFNSDNQNHD